MKTVFVLSPEVVLFVGDTVAFTHPSFACFSETILTESQNFETVVEQRIAFYEVHDVYSNFQVFHGVLHAEMEPLIMSSSVDIVLKDEIVCLDRFALVIFNRRLSAIGIKQIS